MACKSLCIWSLATCQSPFTRLTQIFSTQGSGAFVQSLWPTCLPSPAGPVCLLFLWMECPSLSFSPRFIVFSFTRSPQALVSQGIYPCIFWLVQVSLDSHCPCILSFKYIQQKIFVECLLCTKHCTVTEFIRRNKNQSPNTYHRCPFTYLDANFYFFLYIPG